MQVRFFEKILEKYPKKSQAVEALMEVLNLGKDAIYRRIRGESVLPPEELALLANHFSISVDALIHGQSNKLSFTYNTFVKKVTSFEDYLQQLYEQLNNILQLPEVFLYYATQEVPVFHYMFFPELIAFKLYAWGLTTWNLPLLQQSDFHFGLFSPHAQKKCDDIIKLYNQLPSQELWSLNIVDNTLNQIEYTVISGNFRHPKDALLICDKMLVLIRHQKAMAAAGNKFSPTRPNFSGANFDLYHNELAYTNNTFLINFTRGNLVFTTFCNPNFLQSDNQQLGEHTALWFSNLIQKSNAISRHSAKSRAWFFSRLEKKVEVTYKKIEQHLADTN